MPGARTRCEGGFLPRAQQPSCRVSSLWRSSVAALAELSIRITQTSSPCGESEPDPYSAAPGSTGGRGSGASFGNCERKVEARQKNAILVALAILQPHSKIADQRRGPLSPFSSSPSGPPLLRIASCPRGEEHPPAPTHRRRAQLREATQQLFGRPRFENTQRRHEKSADQRDQTSLAPPQVAAAVQTWPLRPRARRTRPCGSWRAPTI